MGRREASQRVSVPLARSSEGNDSAEFRLTESNVLTGRPERARKKLRISIALIDPKPLTRRSIAEMLAKALPDHLMVAASSCEELLEVQGKPIGSPHLIIVYIRSAGVTDSYVQDALKLVRLRLPEARVIMLSDRDDVEDVDEALTCGVRGYIPTSVESEVAFAALRLIDAGGTYIPAHERRSPTVKSDIGVDGERRGLPDELDLTPRELSVLDLLREGKPNKLIATGLNMEESTVKVHVRNILKKLHADNRTHAASVANRLLGRQSQTTVDLLRPASGAGSSSKARYAEPVGG
jgi:DNA-binding NarL/FixJ family response regulator